MNVKLAFKKDSDSWISKLIKWYTKSKYSHVEIIVPGRDGDFESGFWLSANAKKGVRIKPLILPLNMSLGIILTLRLTQISIYQRWRESLR
jgi:hypothetical protein